MTKSILSLLTVQSIQCAKNGRNIQFQSREIKFHIFFNKNARQMRTNEWQWNVQCYSVQPWKIHQTMNDNNLSFSLGMNVLRIRCRCIYGFYYLFVCLFNVLCVDFMWRFSWCLRLWLVIFLYFGITNVESSQCYDDDNGAHILFFCIRIHFSVFLKYKYIFLLSTLIRLFTVYS